MIEHANGEAIRVIRERSGLSLRALSGLSGVSIAQLSRIEHGGQASPVSIRKIADGLRVPRAAIVDHAPASEVAEVAEVASSA